MRKQRQKRTARINNVETAAGHEGKTTRALMFRETAVSFM